MRIWFGLASLAFAATLSACGGQSGAMAALKTTPAEVEVYVARLSAEPFKMEAKGATDLAGVRDALPKKISLTWAKLDFDAASGATVLTDVKLTPKDMPQIGLGLAEVRLWDFNVDFAKARLAGQRLTETGKLARRIDAKGVSVFGLETIMNSAMQGASNAVTGAVSAQAGPDAAAQVAADMDMKLDSYEFGIERILIDDIQLRPFEMKPIQLPADNEMAQVMPLLQTAAAVARSIAYDTAAGMNFKGKLAMSEAGQQMNMNFSIASSVTRGQRGLDSDVAVVRGMAFDMGMAIPDMPKPMQITGGLDLFSFEGVRLDKLYGYFARGEWPKRTDTNLLQINAAVLKNEHFAINGHEAYSIGEARFEAPTWQWFIPTKLRLSANDVVYDVKGILEFANEVGPDMQSMEYLSRVEPGAPKPVAPKPPASAAPAAPPAPLVPPEVMTLLTKYGLDRPSLDMGLGWTWNPNSGAAVIDGAFGLDNYIRTDLKYEGGFPSFKAVSDLVPVDKPETADGAAISKLFETSSLKSFETTIADEGGLDKIFAIAADIAKMVPPDQAGQAAGILQNQTADGLRRMSVSMIYAAADQAAAMMPDFKPLITPFAAFVEKGGKVKFTARPTKPISVAETDVAITKGTVTPEQFFKQLNAKTVHTPPKAP